MAVNSGAAQMASLLGPDAKGLIFTQVVPFPWAVGIPVVKEYQQALARAAPGAEPSFSSLEGYVNAKVLVAALRAAGKDLSRAGITRALEGARDPRRRRHDRDLRAGHAYRLDVRRHGDRRERRTLLALASVEVATSFGRSA